jgi:hypothetical protein
MGKYKIDFSLFLNKFADENYRRLYSPDGNTLTVVSNGWVNGHLLYDHKTKKVYGLCLKEVTNANEEYIEQCEGQWAKEQIPFNMNYKEAIEFLEKKGKL